MKVVNQPHAMGFGTVRVCLSRLKVEFVCCLLSVRVKPWVINCVNILKHFASRGHCFFYIHRNKNLFLIDFDVQPEFRKWPIKMERNSESGGNPLRLRTKYPRSSIMSASGKFSSGK